MTSPRNSQSQLRTTCHCECCESISFAVSSFTSSLKLSKLPKRQCKEESRKTMKGARKLTDAHGTTEPSHILIRKRCRSSPVAVSAQSIENDPCLAMYVSSSPYRQSALSPRRKVPRACAPRGCHQGARGGGSYDATMPPPLPSDHSLDAAVKHCEHCTKQT